MIRLLLLACAGALSISAQTNIDNGKKLFEKYGCYQCHGYVGQGGLNGPRLAQTRLTLPAFTAIVRTPPPSSMPPFRAKVISDKDLGDVYAYIKSIPEPKAVKDIPLLNQATPNQ